MVVMKILLCHSFSNNCNSNSGRSRGTYNHDGYLETALIQYGMKWHRECTYTKYNYTERTNNKTFNIAVVTIVVIIKMKNVCVSLNSFHPQPESENVLTSHRCAYLAKYV